MRLGIRLSPFYVSKSTRRRRSARVGMSAGPFFASGSLYKKRKPRRR